MSYWSQHGTKILGSAIAGIAALQVAAPQFQILLSAKGYAWFQIATSFVLATLGSLTVKRGFANARRPRAVNTHDDGTAGESQ
jgi:hypothetical protein